MKILLTGATGFIGSHVARSFVRAGHEVHALVRADSDLRRIADIRSSLRFVEGDLLAGRFAIPAVECCVHLAWYVQPGKYLDSPLNQEYLSASLALARRGFPRFVGAGTCFEYALTGGVVTESTPTGPRSPYATAKLELFQALQQIDTELAWARFFYQYGPYEDPRRLVPVVINSLRRGAQAKLTAGERVRDYLHVSDVGNAVASVATTHLGGAVNIGSGERTTLCDIAGKIGELLGRPELLKFGAIPYRPDEPLDILADNSRLRTTGWLPRFNLESGLRETIEWWQYQPLPTPSR